MSALDRGDVPRDGDDPYVSYFDGGQLVVQTFRGELIIVGETVEVER